MRNSTSPEINFDERLLAGLLLVLAAPTLVLVWLSILTLSGAPTLVLEESWRKDGSCVRLYRFRTSGSGRWGFATIGGWLRRFQVDELPELFSVSNGSASFRDLNLSLGWRRS